jgi:hypothetical protein
MNDLANYISERKRELAKAESKAKFFASQYEKYGEQQKPDEASDHKLQMEHACALVHLLKSQITKMEVLQKRRDAAKAKRKQ